MPSIELVDVALRLVERAEGIDTRKRDRVGSALESCEDAMECLYAALLQGEGVAEASGAVVPAVSPKPPAEPQRTRERGVSVLPTADVVRPPPPAQLSGTQVEQRQQQEIQKQAEEAAHLRSVIHRQVQQLESLVKKSNEMREENSKLIDLLERPLEYSSLLGTPISVPEAVLPPPPQSQTPPSQPEAAPDATGRTNTNGARHKGARAEKEAAPSAADPSLASGSEAAGSRETSQEAPKQPQQLDHLQAAETSADLSLLNGMLEAAITQAERLDEKEADAQAKDAAPAVPATATPVLAAAAAPEETPPQTPPPAAQPLPQQASRQLTAPVDPRAASVESITVEKAASQSPEAGQSPPPAPQTGTAAATLSVPGATPTTVSPAAPAPEAPALVLTYRYDPHKPPRESWGAVAAPSTPVSLLKQPAEQSPCRTEGGGGVGGDGTLPPPTPPPESTSSLLLDLPSPPPHHSPPQPQPQPPPPHSPPQPPHTRRAPPPRAVRSMSPNPPAPTPPRSMRAFANQQHCDGGYSPGTTSPHRSAAAASSATRVHASPHSPPPLSAAAAATPRSAANYRRLGEELQGGLRSPSHAAGAAGRGGGGGVDGWLRSGSADGAAAAAAAASLPYAAMRSAANAQHSLAESRSPSEASYRNLSNLQSLSSPQSTVGGPGGGGGLARQQAADTPPDMRCAANTQRGLHRTGSDAASPAAPADMRNRVNELHVVHGAEAAASSSDIGGGAPGSGGLTAAASFYTAGSAASLLAAVTAPSPAESSSAATAVATGGATDAAAGPAGTNFASQLLSPTPPEVTFPPPEASGAAWLEARAVLDSLLARTVESDSDGETRPELKKTAPLAASRRGGGDGAAAGSSSSGTDATAVVGGVTPLGLDAWGWAVVVLVVALAVATSASVYGWFDLSSSVEEAAGYMGGLAGSLGGGGAPPQDEQSTIDSLYEAVHGLFGSGTAEASTAETGTGWL